MKLALIILALICFVPAFAATELVIEKTDGTVLRIDTSQIKNMGFTDPLPAQNQDWTLTGLLAYWALNSDAYD